MTLYKSKKCNKSRRISSKFGNFAKSARGATAIEYGLIVSLVVIGMLVGLQNFAGTSTTGFNGSMNKLSNAITAR